MVIALFALVATLFLQDKHPRDDGGRRRGRRLRAAGHARQSVCGPGDSDRTSRFASATGSPSAGIDGVVTEVTWRATKIRTKAGNFVDRAEQRASRRTSITNYSEPTRDTRIEVEVGVSYDTPPNEVKAVLREALRDDPLFSTDRRPEVLLVDFAASAITYRGARLDERLSRRTRGPRSHAVAHLLRVPAPRHHDSVSDSGATSRRACAAAGPPRWRRRSRPSRSSRR